MKSKFDLKSILFGILLGGVVVASIGAADISRPATFEYKTLDVNSSATDLDRKLNEAASEDWTVVATSLKTGDGNRTLVICKRARR